MTGSNWSQWPDVIGLPDRISPECAGKWAGGPARVPDFARSAMVLRVLHAFSECLYVSSPTVKGLPTHRGRAARVIEHAFRQFVDARSDCGSGHLVRLRKSGTVDFENLDKCIEGYDRCWAGRGARHGSEGRGTGAASRALFPWPAVRKTGGMTDSQFGEHKGLISWQDTVRLAMPLQNRRGLSLSNFDAWPISVIDHVRPEA